MTEQARLDVEESEEAIAQYQKEIEELKQAQEAAEAETTDKWDQIIADVTEIGINPYKKDILVTLFGVAWFPYHVVDSEGRSLELPAFGAEEDRGR
jgi:hypothetical protein